MSSRLLFLVFLHSEKLARDSNPSADQLGGYSLERIPPWAVNTVAIPDSQ